MHFVLANCSLTQIVLVCFISPQHCNA